LQNSSEEITIEVPAKYLHFVNFYRDAFKVLEPQTPYLHNWHIDYICTELQAETYRILDGDRTNGDIIINVPFRSSKSLLTTIIYPVWSWVINPYMSFITASFSNQLSTEHARKSRQLIQSDWFIENFGHLFQIVTDQNVKSNYENDKGGKRFATSVTGTVTGMGADVIIMDDPLNPKMAYSEIERNNVNRAYSETFYSRTKNPHTAVRIIVMQRLHEDDLSGYLLNKGGYRHICIPGEATESLKPTKLSQYYKNGLFWPERFNDKILHEYRVSLGSAGYAGQILQQPAPPEGNIFKAKWFDIVNEVPEGLVWNYRLDTAYTSNKANDPSALLAYATDGNFFYFREVEQVWLEFPQLCEYIKTFVMHNGYTSASRIYIEPKASGKSIVQQIKSTTGLNVLEDKAPDTDKVTRANAVSAMVEAGRVKLIAGSWNRRFLDEVTQFPYAKHDDQVDVMVMALQSRQQKKGFVII